MNRWERLQQLFAQALALPAGEREAFIVQACGEDTAMARDLRSLLAADDAGDAAVQSAIGTAATRWADAGRQGLIGQQLGPWRITAHIADGGMGAVFRAERADGQYEQPAALKLLNPALVSAAAQERLALERQILARLSHPHIARLLDGGRTPEGLPYLVMEFVDGQPIDTWCHSRGLDTPARLRLFMQVCAAVDYAHRNLVVHRDLTPSNILVTAEAGPMLLDFGIAKLLQTQTETETESATAAGLTRSGEQLLTPSHASPEQITGAPVTTATDVYALGVLLYDLLAGQRPHEAAQAHPAQLARAIVETEPPRPSTAVALSTATTASGATSNRRLAQLQQRGDSLTPERLARELQGDLDNIVLMALRKEPERRYASAAALAEDIGRHLAHLPVRARPDTLAYRSAKLWRRHPLAVPASALALLLALGGSGVFTWQLAQERDRALAAEAAARQAEDSAQRAAAFSASVLARTAAEDDAEREVSVQALLQRAAQRSADELAGDATVGAQVDLALGNALTSWGRYEEGLAVLRRGLAHARQRGEAGRGDAAALHGAEAVALHGLGRLEEGLEAAQASQALFEQVGTPRQQAQATLDVAMALNSLRRRDEAEPVFRDAIARLRSAHADEQGGDHDNLAFALNNLAWNLHARARLAEAAPLYEEALAMQQRLGLGIADTGQTLNNLAGLSYDQGDLARADTLWRQALQGYEALYGPDGHAAVARAYSTAALVPLLRGQHEEALALTARAKAANLRLVGEQHRWTASTMLSYGTALMEAGRLDEARGELLQALAIRRAVLPAGHGDFVSVHHALGRLALAQGRPQSAETELRRALQIADALGDPGRRRVDQVALHLGRALALQGRADEAQLLAERARRLASTRFEAGDWRLLALQAQLRLPPFASPLAPPLDAAGRAEVQATLDLLRQRLSPQAPLVRDIEQALAQAG